MPSTENFKDELYNIVTVLCGTQPVDYPAEKRLRLFQLKAWLLEDSRDDERILADARMLFAAMHLGANVSREIEEARTLTKLLTASEALTRLKRNNTIRTMLDVCFGDPRGLYGLTQISNAWTYKADKRVLAKIASVNTYTRYCMRVDANPAARPVKETAMMLYRAEAAERRQADRGRPLSKDIKQLLIDRRQRLAFSYVASLRGFAFLTKVDPRVQQMGEILTSQAEDEKLFKGFFAHCAHVQRVMAHGTQVTSHDLYQWAGLKPGAFKGAVPITDEELAKARLHDEKTQDA